MSDEPKLFGSAKTYEKPKKQKKQARARVRCPYCWEALKLTENDEPDQVVIAHGRKCWWLEKNGKGHAEMSERGLKKETTDSFEEDEPVEKIKETAKGKKGVTKRPERKLV